jgi:hypothetical protein
LTEFDYLVVGGRHGRLHRSIRRWAEMLEGEYDLDYRSVFPGPQTTSDTDISALARDAGGRARRRPDPPGPLNGTPGLQAPGQEPR